MWLITCVHPILISVGEKAADIKLLKDIVPRDNGISLYDVHYVTYHFIECYVYLIAGEFGKIENPFSQIMCSGKWLYIYLFCVQVMGTA